MPESVDVAIIGGGVMGCAIAWQLAKNGVSCALVERGSFGGGASGATAGVVGPLWHLDPEDPDMFRLGMRSLELFPAWASELTEAGVNPEFQQTGVLKAAFAEDEVEELQGFHRWQSQLGFGVEWLERDDVLRREPNVSPEVRAAIFSPQEGCVRGQRLCDSLAHAAGRLGAKLYEGVEVTGLRHAGERITGWRPLPGKLHPVMWCWRPGRGAASVAVGRRPAARWTSRCAASRDSGCCCGVPDSCPCRRCATPLSMLSPASTETSSWRQPARRAVPTKRSPPRESQHWCRALSDRSRRWATPPSCRPAPAFGPLLRTEGPS